MVAVLSKGVLGPDFDQKWSNDHFGQNHLIPNIFRTNFELLRICLLSNFDFCLAHTLWQDIITTIIPWEFFFEFLRGFALSKCPGNNDFFKELRVRFVVLPKIIIPRPPPPPRTSVNLWALLGGGLNQILRTRVLWTTLSFYEFICCQISIFVSHIFLGPMVIGAGEMGSYANEVGRIWPDFAFLFSPVGVRP